MKFFLVVSLIALIGNVPAVAQSAKNAPTPLENARTKHFRLTSKRVAIDGYDPVSYFKDGPEKGAPNRAYEYDGVIYHFATDANLAKFKADPNRYEPAWGGWCGHAMAFRGEKVTINPKCYKIIGGRNVLFYKTAFANALTNWERDIKTNPESELTVKGDRFWVDILKK